MEYQVILDDFQGPLDLLLHLIKEKEMDLQTLELSVITDQYLQYIHMMESSQLEVMSEYLVMAAQLIEMKSKMLLPKQKPYKLKMSIKKIQEKHSLEDLLNIKDIKMF